MSLASDLQLTLREKGPLRLIRYALETPALLFVFLLFKILPLDAASALGGFLGRTLGPMLGVHRRAEKHLRQAMPEVDEKTRTQTLSAMWDNLGRTMAEYPHLRTIMNTGRITLKGGGHLEALKTDGKPGLLVSGHIGNWELVPLAATLAGFDVAIVYRKPNNPFVAALLDEARKASSDLRAPKGSAGGLKLFRHLKAGGHAALLVDQKLNEGLPLRFFGRTAMTAPAVAEWALRLQAPLVLLYVKRLEGVRFEITVDPPLALPAQGDHAAASLMQTINDRLEAHIRRAPAQWLWIHNRWREE